MGIIRQPQASPVTDLTQGFETECCTRCGGGGSYAFNLMDGTVCYGCFGRGTQKTKRGAAAYAFFMESLKVAAKDVQVGWRIKSSTSGKWFTVVASHETESTTRNLDPQTRAVISEYKNWNLQYGQMGHHSSPDMLVDALPSEEVRVEKVKAALAYQQTLTKTGKPCKK